jgi:hypothetical protein
MRKNGRPKPENGPARDLRPVAPDSPILTYRLADIPDIFSLYLDAVEVALRNSLESANVPDAGGRHRVRTGKPATWHPV